MNEKEKRKILISSIIIIITLILVVVGTTYAFFSLQIEGEETTTNVEITTGEQNEINLSGGITNYHIKLDVSDMTEDKIGTPYYGTTVSGKNYEETEEAGTQDIGTLTKKGTLTDKYICSADININLDGDMQEFLQDNDLVLVVKQGSTSNTYDLSNVSTKNTFRFKLDNDNIEPIKAYLKFTNQESDQSDLAGTSLNISINIDNFTCAISVGKEPLEMLREHATGGNEAVTFTEEDVDGMYRYKGTATQVTNNYICFGTDDTEKCLDTPEDYMYRIIGITNKEDNTINLPANSLKIIKATQSSTSQPWYKNYNEDIKWDDSDIKKYLNETFLPDAISKWDNGTTWDSIILSHSWYNADYESVPVAEPTTSHTDASKIGLMYATDYKNSGDQNTDNWLFLMNEWTMSKYGYGSNTYDAWRVVPGGNLKHLDFGGKYGARPVFYVSPIITLTGEGNTENPFIIYSYLRTVFKKGTSRTFYLTN